MYKSTLDSGFLFSALIKKDPSIKIHTQVLISCFSSKNLLKTGFSLSFNEKGKIRLTSTCVSPQNNSGNLLKNLIFAIYSKHQLCFTKNNTPPTSSTYSFDEQWAF